MTGSITISSRLERVRQEIADAALRAGRDPREVQLIAVSKGFPAVAIEEARAAGQRDFGENRVQELISKAPLEGVRWHFIGRLQRNKVGKLVRVADVIHSVDSLDLAREINARAPERIEVLIEVNVAGESHKGGVEPPALPELVEGVLSMENLELTGLMTMAPKVEDPELARPVFKRLAELRAQMAEAYSCARIHHLSMGMSQDYRVAVEEGSTLVRAGEAIFGPRGRRVGDPSDTER